MILKIGSQGPEVIALQTFLKLNVDGDFGTKTETAVKNWQKAHGLNPDGVVGDKTFAAMGLLTTDSTDRTIQTDGLVFDKKYLPTNEYLAGPTRKEWIFLHHTAGWHNPYNVITDWGSDTRGAIATEFVLGGQSCKGNDDKYDGVVVQSFPAGGYAWHLGTGNSPMHRNSVAIEICNFGQIVNGKNYVGTVCAPDQINTLPKPFRGYKTHHRYSDKQIEVLKNWILYIANRDNIDPTKGLIELIKTKGEDAFDFYDVAYCEAHPSLWLHSNCRMDKVDLFPQQEVIDMLLSL